MERMTLGKTGIEANRLAFGGIPIQRVSEEEAVQTVLHAVESGIDYIDTARAYTTSEHRIGLALKQTDKKVAIGTKTHARNADGVKKDIEISLKELQRNYIDIYQCHGVGSKEDYNKIIGPGGALEALEKAKEDGLIGHIGATSHSLDLVDYILDEGVFETIMICFSFLEPKAMVKIIPKAIEKNVGVIAMKPFSGGVIENSGLALKFTLSVPGVLVLAGVEHKELVDENWKVFARGDFTLTESEKKEIEEVQKQFDKKFCRRCDYCQPCTENIPIQFVLGMRSIVKRMGPSALQRGGRMAMMVEKAKECSECGECMTRCPYELPIPDLIKENVKWAEEIMASF
jgi:predicted aldo/keto reductase-like oxidoreductase